METLALDWHDICVGTFFNLGKLYGQKRQQALASARKSGGTPVAVSATGQRNLAHESLYGYHIMLSIAYC
jgi:hypothetical protein